MRKPDDMFGRDAEWRRLERFVDSAKPGATMGLVYGRRRQGKTFLLESVTDARQGLYVQALRQSASQNLQRLADAYNSHINSRVGGTFTGWDLAFDALLALGEAATRPVPVVVDEFPHLVEGAPQLPSLLQSLLRPRSPAAMSSPTRLILCGSALSTMTGLLSGTAPLRGRAALELVVHPFDFREAAEFWGVADHPELALRLHALVGGTAGYRDMSGGDGPRRLGELDDWVAETLLDPASAMFREGHILLAEEHRVNDTSLYFSVLGAISHGKTRRGEIAAATGRAEGSLAHPLAVLIEAGLVAPMTDALRRRRTTFHIAEPVLRLHQLVIAPNEYRLGRRQAPAVWAGQADTVAARIYGPHFEELARRWCVDHAAIDTIGGDRASGCAVSDVATTVVPCRGHRVSHEVDAVVLGHRPGTRTNSVLAIGEAKWRREACDITQLRRLEHIRALLGAAETVKLLIFSRGGFTRGLQQNAAGRQDVELIDLDRLYTGS